jgi:hypothetical protein
MSALTTYLAEIRQHFQQADKYVAHAASAELLKALGDDRAALYEVFTRNITRPGFFSERNTNPVLRFDIADEPTHSIYFHGWIPRTDSLVTHQSIHHHGKLLLTSYAAFGPGYQSIRFKRGFSTDPVSLDTSMEMDKFYRNPQGHLEFIDTATPHVVFLPTAFTVTLALWSLDAPTKAEGIKNNPFIQRNKKYLRALVDSLGLRKAVGLNKMEDFDFYPEGGKLKLLKERKHYPDGSLAIRTQNAFYVLQQYGYANQSAFEEMRKVLTPAEALLVTPWLDVLLAGQPIAPAIDPLHKAVPQVTIGFEEIASVFPGILSE